MALRHRQAQCLDESVELESDSVFGPKMLSLENGASELPTCTVLIMVLAFDICETITKQRLFGRHLTPMLGKDLFFDEPFM